MQCAVASSAYPAATHGAGEASRCCGSSTTPLRLPETALHTFSTTLGHKERFAQPGQSAMAAVQRQALGAAHAVLSLVSLLTNLQERDSTDSTRYTRSSG